MHLSSKMMVVARQKLHLQSQGILKYHSLGLFCFGFGSRPGMDAFASTLRSCILVSCYLVVSHIYFLQT